MRSFRVFKELFVSPVRVQLSKHKNINHSNGDTITTNTQHNTTQHAVHNINNTRIQHTNTRKQDKFNLTSYTYSSKSTVSQHLRFKPCITFTFDFTLQLPHHVLTPSHHAKAVNVTKLKHHASSRSERASTRENLLSLDT